ncbi:MAG: hypothetical protein HOB82_09300 [Alphaproteobacteria bacterium]|jgi:hypothetical protein|nr:hypothetical protein [Alphaproteobacteria bacterium]MBT5860060.1 hypothetical protein [Alphaproteobacteria bacterium]
MRLIAAALAGTLGLAACEEPVKFPLVPVPELGDGPISLRVARAINPRFPNLAEEEISEVLALAGTLIHDQFGLTVQFDRGDDYSVDELLMATPSPAIEFGAHYVFNMVDADRSPQVLVKWIADSLIDPRTDIFSARRYFENAIPGVTTMEIERLAEAIAENWMQGRLRWQDLTAQDGERVIDDIGHQLAVWDFAGYGEFPFEIVITNLLVASVQLYKLDPRIMLRGGVVIGTTGFSRSGQFGAITTLSTFTMINDVGDLNELGPDPIFDRANATTYAAMILAREIGYMLLHLGPSWDNPSCVMFVVPPGGMGDHMRSLDPAQCPMGSERAMNPGAAAISYDRELLEAVERQ